VTCVYAQLGLGNLVKVLRMYIYVESFEVSVHAQSLLEMVPSLNGSKVNTLITADDSPCNDDLFTVEEELILED